MSRAVISASPQSGVPRESDIWQGGLCSCGRVRQRLAAELSGTFAALALSTPICLLPPGLGLFPCHQGKEVSSYGHVDPLNPATFSAGTFLALGWGWGPPELGHSFPPSLPGTCWQHEAFLAQPPHQAGTTRCFLEGGAYWIHAHLAPPGSGLAPGCGCVYVYVYGKSLPLDTWVWVPSFELEGGSCDLALNHPGIRLQLEWDVSEDECFRKIWKTFGTRPAICLGKDARVVS